MTTFKCLLLRYGSLIYISLNFNSLHRGVNRLWVFHTRYLITASTNDIRCVSEHTCVACVCVCVCEYPSSARAYTHTPKPFGYFMIWMYWANNLTQRIMADKKKYSLIVGCRNNKTNAANTLSNTRSALILWLRKVCTTVCLPIVGYIMSTTEDRPVRVSLQYDRRLKNSVHTTLGHARTHDVDDDDTNLLPQSFIIYVHDRRHDARPLFQHVCFAPHNRCYYYLLRRTRSTWINVAHAQTHNTWLATSRI